MGTLSEDLALYANEAFTKRDVIAGLRLLGELAGLVSLYATAIALSTVTIPFLGPTLTRQIVIALSRAGINEYGKLSTQERKQVRAVIRWIRPAANASIVAETVSDTAFFADVADSVADSEEWASQLADFWRKLKGKDKSSD